MYVRRYKYAMISQGSHMNRDSSLAMDTNLIFKFQSAVYSSILAMKLLSGFNRVKRG